jgi:hypothetical protein
MELTFIGLYANLGSILVVNGEQNETYISDIQHVRRRETIAMTPSDSFTALKLVLACCYHKKAMWKQIKSVLDSIRTITNTTTKPLVASSGLSIQYAIMMGLIHDAVENIKEKRSKL